MMIVFILLNSSAPAINGGGVKLDMNIIIALLGGVTAFVAAIFKGVNDLKTTDIEKEKVQKDIDNTLGNLFKSIEVIERTAVENSEQLKLNRQSNIAQQRYILQKDLLTAILRGNTNRHEKMEIMALYENYRKLGGNGVIKDLYEDFNKIEVIEDE